MSTYSGVKTVRWTGQQPWVSIGHLQYNGVGHRIIGVQNEGERGSGSRHLHGLYLEVCMGWDCGGYSIIEFHISLILASKSLCMTLHPIKGLY